MGKERLVASFISDRDMNTSMLGGQYTRKLISRQRTFDFNTERALDPRVRIVHGKFSLCISFPGPGKLIAELAPGPSITREANPKDLWCQFISLCYHSLTGLNRDARN